MKIKFSIIIFILTLCYSCYYPISKNYNWSNKLVNIITSFKISKNAKDFLSKKGLLKENEYDLIYFYNSIIICHECIVEYTYLVLLNEYSNMNVYLVQIDKDDSLQNYNILSSFKKHKIEFNNNDFPWLDKPSIKLLFDVKNELIFAQYGICDYQEQIYNFKFLEKHLDLLKK